MTLRLKGSNSGDVSLKAPATAGDNTITLPTSNGSAEQFLKNSGTAGELEFSNMVETSTGVGVGVTTAPANKIAHSRHNKWSAIPLIGISLSEWSAKFLRLQKSNDDAGVGLSMHSTPATARWHLGQTKT